MYKYIEWIIMLLFNMKEDFAEESIHHQTMIE